jgi:hypothetical protein
MKFTVVEWLISMDGATLSDFFAFYVSILILYAWSMKMHLPPSSLNLSLLFLVWLMNIFSSSSRYYDWFHILKNRGNLLLSPTAFNQESARLRACHCKIILIWFKSLMTGLGTKWKWSQMIINNTVTQLIYVSSILWIKNYFNQIVW